MSDETNRVRRRLVAGSLLTIGGVGFLATSSAHAQVGRRTLPSLGGATGWLNSAALTADSLRGKVVLVDIWTFTCINWLRTLPYVRAWSEKYKNQGLVVVGAHCPEFEFERNIDNVRRAVKDLRVSHPVAIDNDFAIWRALRNNAWPARYFVDAKGSIRHVQVGEGEYAQGEMIIKQLLSEAGADVDRSLVSLDAQGVEAPPDWRNLRSPETYVGYERTDNFSSTSRALLDKRQTYAAPARLGLNQWAVSGDWTFRKQLVALNAPNGRVAFRFQARDLHLVMGLAKPGASVQFRVSIDGQPPRATRGVDVDEGGSGRVTEQRLYQLLRQQSPIRDRQFEIEFFDSAVEAFAFTFG